jgi:hypothetical protein
MDGRHAPLRLLGRHSVLLAAPSDGEEEKMASWGLTEDFVYDNFSNLTAYEDEVCSGVSSLFRRTKRP